MKCHTGSIRRLTVWSVASFITRFTDCWNGPAAEQGLYFPHLLKVSLFPISFVSCVYSNWSQQYFMTKPCFDVLMLKFLDYVVIRWTLPETVSVARDLQLLNSALLWCCSSNVSQFQLLMFSCCLYAIEINNFSLPLLLFCSCVLCLFIPLFLLAAMVNVINAIYLL